MVLVDSLTTFDTYRDAFPNLVRNGRVRCCNCGGTSLWMKRTSTGWLFTTQLFAHTCRTCGTELYYSPA